jgi:hypothetical protein
MRPKKRRQSWPLPAKQRRRDDRTVTLSQIVHLTLRRMFDPDANFDEQRRPEYLRTDPPKTCALCDDPHGSEFSPAPTGPCSTSLSADDGHESRCATEWSEAMKDNDWISEREYQHRLESLLKDSLNTQLRPLMSLETATKKRRAQKKKAANNSGFTKSTTTTSG